jgi:hypothetical protein
MEAQVRAFLKTGGWTLAADFTGIALLASLMVGGTGSPVFALLLLAAPFLLAACMLWDSED